MDCELYGSLIKKIKAMSGGNYVGSKTTIDEAGEHLELKFKKQDGTIETTIIDFPKPKDGKDGAKGEKGDKGDKGEPGGGGGKDSAILDELEKNNIFYYREGAIKNPVEGDRRDTGRGIGKNGDEVFSKGQWVKKIEVGSIGTDMITLRNGLNDIKAKELSRTYNIARKLKTMDGIQIGSSFSPLALTTNGIKNAKLYYPDTDNLRNFELNNIKNQKVALPAYAELHWHDEDSIVKSMILCTEKESRMRIRLYYTEESVGTPLMDIIPKLTDETMVYESMPDTEFKNPDNRECYGGVVVPTGINEIDLRNEMYLTNERRYIIEFDSCTENHFIGNGSIPYCAFNFWYEKSEAIVTDSGLEERLKNDIVLDYNMWLSTLSRPNENKKPETRNMIGMREDDFQDGAITVGDDGEKTVLWTDRDAYIKSSNDRIEHLTSYERMTMEAIPKIYNANQCIEGQIALLIETNPKTYTTWERQFPTYKLGDINNKVYRFSCTFSPIVGRVNRLFTDFGSRRLDFYHAENESVGIRFGYYLDNGDYVDYSINLRDVEKLKEDPRWNIPRNAYIIDRSKIYEDLKRPWKIDMQTIGSEFTLTIIDPDLLRWEFTDIVLDVDGEDVKPKPHHIFSGGDYYVGHFNQSETVKMLQNVIIDSKNGDIVNNVNEIVKEIKPINLVTRLRKQIFDIGGSEGKWEPKVIDVSSGDNVDVIVNSEQYEIISDAPSITFTNHPEYDKTSRCVVNLPSTANYNVEWSVSTSPVHAVMRNITIDGQVINTGLNTIYLSEGEHTIEVLANGTAWSLDGGDTWKSGTFPSVRVSFVSDGKECVKLFDKESKITPKLIHQQSNEGQMDIIKIVIDNNYTILNKIDPTNLIKSITKLDNTVNNWHKVEFTRQFIKNWQYSVIVRTESLGDLSIPVNDANVNITNKSTTGFNVNICTVKDSHTTILIYI